MIKRTGKMTLGIQTNSKYIDLLKSFPPRPIISEEELNATQKVIDSLIYKGELTPDEQDYLNVLGILVYEHQLLYQEPIPKLQGVKLIKALLEEHNLEKKDLLPIFKSESTFSEVLSAKRKLTAEQIRQLADFFQMSPADFFESEE